MQRHPVRVSLVALLSAVMLQACGGNLEALPAAPEEALGTQESALCSGLTVTTLSISGASTYQGEMAASGPWAVSSGANAIRLEYYIDNVLYASEERTGSSGTWYFSQSPVSCGTHTLLVKGYPMVIDSNGNRTTCWGAPNSTSQPVTEACPGGTWVLIGTENCYDLIMASCYTRLWTPSCPSNPAGQSCPTVGATCWSVVSSSTLREYECQ